MRLIGMVLAIASASSMTGAASATPVPAQFESVGVDRQTISTLLDTYTKAVSTKNEALFETLLLNTSISFSGLAPAPKVASAANGFRNYADFRKGVFEGPPFTQRFEDVHIEQDGPLAEVSLVFVNTTATGSSWGWKSLQLVKVAGAWKIASEFYTGHAGSGPVEQLR